MNIGEFTGLSREAQFAKAAEIASESGVKVDPSTFDGIWRTESARGAAMRSPAGAKGHFGLMDPTRQTWERRFGTTIDPDDFGQSLFTSAHTMKENLTRFKNVPDALRAYNGGWEPSKWGNPETAAYAGKVLGGDNGMLMSANASTAAAVRPAALATKPASAYWDTPFDRPAKPPAPLKQLDKAMADAQAVEAVGGGQAPAEPRFTAWDALAAATGAADIKRREETDARGILDLARASAIHSAPVRLLMVMNRDPEPIDPSFQVKEDMLKGYNLDDQQELLTAGSQAAFDRIKFTLDYTKEQDQIAGSKGILMGIAAGAIATGPEAVLSGGAATLAIGRTAIGSITLAERGMKAASLVSSGAEGIAGNVINTVALDMLGDRQGVNAYALAAGMGLINPILGGRYLGRTADAFNESTAAAEAVQVAARKEATLMAQAVKNIGDSEDMVAIKAEMNRLEAEGIRADIASHRQAIPETRKMEAGDPEDVAAAKGETAEAPAVAAPKVEVEVAPANDGPLAGMSEDDYIRAINPEGKVREFDEAMPLEAFKDVQATGPIVATKGDVNIRQAAGFLVAEQGGRAVGYMAPEGNTTGLFVAEEMRGKGIGEMLSTEYRTRNPLAPSGGLSAGGEAVARKVYRKLKAAEPASEQRLSGKLADQYGENKVTPRYEDPKYQEQRVLDALTNPQFDKNLRTLSGLGYEEMSALPAGVHLSADMQAAVSSNAAVASVAKAVMELASEYLPKDARIVIGTGTVSTPGKAGPRGQILSAGNVHAIGLNLDDMSPAGMRQLQHTAYHELGHAIYHQHAPTAPKELNSRIANEYEEFVSKALAGDVSARGDRLAVTHPSRFDQKPIALNAYALSKDEYLAEQFVQHLQNRLLSGKYGKLSTGTINQVINGVKAALNYIKDLIGQGKVKPGKAADEFFTGILEGNFTAKAAADEFLAPNLRLPDLAEVAANSDIPPALSKEVNDFLNDPVVQRHNLDRLPMGTPAERAEAQQIKALYAKAESPEYIVDEKRLSTLLSKVDALNPTSNMMLRSKNPVVRMAAIELLENGGGAAGRRSTASIAKWMNERAIVGDSIVKMDREFRGWFKTQPGASNMGEAFTGKKRAEFNRLVAEEVEQRRYPGQQTDFGQSVRNAADAMEASFERARLMQVDAKTAGWAALPETSRGYMPHRIKSLTYRNLTLEQKRALHENLTDQFITVSKFDPTFADQLASRYLDRTEQRALGGFDTPAGLHQVGASDMVREALEQMGLNRQEVDAMMKRHVAGAAAHTKKRLDIDLRKTITSEDGSTFTLLDLYDTDMLSLLRSQSQRVSGEVALARHGVMGKPGLTILRRAMAYGGNGEQAVAKEIGAFDQVAAEFLGQPFGETNKWVDRAVQFNSVSSLGGMGFNQLGEQINVGATLGVKSALQYVTEFGRIRAEILGKTAGKKVQNELLDSLETMGGTEFGTDAYKMVFPLDNPDLFANSMGADSITGADRLLRGAGHLQSKLSLWRTIHSTQTRFVAEQIVLKAAKAMKNKTNDFHMRDMGITDDVFNRIAKDIDKIAVMRDGKIAKFDITQATDKEAAHEFIQAIHRGGSQIIQGTFIGENGKYVHNSWLRMLTQFRSFSLTAIDKQWNRQVGNRGISGAVLVTLAAMSAAAPIYMIRTLAASVGRADQDEYLEKHLSFGAIARSTTNYIATSGLAGDFLDAATAITGTGEFTGGRSGTATTAVGNLAGPALGKVDKLWGAVQNTKDGTDPHALVKELPLSRLPFFIPAINSLSD